MGFDLCWNKIGDCEDLPEEFEYRIVGRKEFYGVMLSCAVVYYNPGCCAKAGFGFVKHAYGCDGTDWVRPVNFTEFRTKLEEIGLMREPFSDMTDYLERNPNMFIDGSW